MSMKVEPEEAQRVLQWFLDKMGKFDVIDRGTLMHSIRADRRRQEKEGSDEKARKETSD